NRATPPRSTGGGGGGDEAAGCGRLRRVPRSVLLRRGSIYTPAHPAATAMLTVDGRIAWVGSEDEADRYADDAAEVVDLAGALVAPAFVDAHVHVTATGLAELGVPLTDARSL